jgi:hypothetical protein
VGQVEGTFPELMLEVGRRLHLGDTVVVVWSCDYGDGQLYRNVTNGELARPSRQLDLPILQSVDDFTVLFEHGFERLLKGWRLVFGSMDRRGRRFASDDHLGGALTHVRELTGRRLE